MRYRLNKHIVLSGVPEGPFARYLPAFASWLSQQGYTAHYLHRHIMLAACFSQWLKRGRVACRCINSEHPSLYLRCRHRRRRAVSGDMPSLCKLMTFLRERRVISAERISAPRLSQLSAAHEPTSSTCAETALWPKLRSSTMFRSSESFFNIDSATELCVFRI